MNKYKVAFVTGSRAEYGIVRNYLKYLDNDETIDFEILVTGSLLSNEYGHQVDLIYKDGFKVRKEIDIDLNTKNNSTIIHSMSLALDLFGQYFEDNKYDLLIILGDRYEMLPIATAASIQRIPILHIHGGEATFANYDEFIRHSITKMSKYHFTSCEEYRNRVIQLGENPKYVFNLGSLGAENCLNIDLNNVPNEVKNLKDKSYYVVLFHPETLTDFDESKQIDELLSAIDIYKDIDFIFIGSNADTHSDVIRNKVKKYCEDNDNSYYYENLHTDAYHYLLKHSLGLIGNSSSGLIEAPSLLIPTLNIGHRQDGRVRGRSVIDVKCDRDEISKAIKSMADLKVDSSDNPYYQKDAAIKYYKETLNILNNNDKDVIKIFYDLK